MRTLYIISKGMDKPSDEEILENEKNDLQQRDTLLESAISANMLDERYLAHKPPLPLRIFYRWLPMWVAQVIETIRIHRNFDVILAHTDQVGLPLAFVMKYLRISTPFAIMLSRITSMYESKSRKKKWLLKHSHTHIDRIIMWSSVQRNIVVEEIGVPAEKVHLTKLGTDQNFWRPLDAETDKICAVGMEMRDYPTLIEALDGTDIPCHLAIGYSRGELFETIQKVYDLESIPENITIGRKSHPELRKLYSESLFSVIPLLPTDSDNGMTAILESMAMGKTVICSKVEGQVDVIQEGETGLFVPQGDPVALRKAILELWNDPERARTMGRAARTYIEQHHTLEEFVNAVSGELQQISGFSDKRDEYSQPLKLARPDHSEEVMAASHYRKH